jgi:hypothetical protein
MSGLFRGALALFFLGSVFVALVSAQQLATLSTSVTDQSAAGIPQGQSQLIARGFYFKMLPHFQ